MKTLLIVVLMLFALTASQAQIKGIPIDEAVPAEDVEDQNIRELYGKLIKTDDEDMVVYTYFYEVKGKGYYDALKELEYILDANDIKRDPDTDDTYFQSNVERDNYNDVAFELRMETGWIQEVWSVYDDKWKIFIVGIADAISVGVIHIKSSAATEYVGRSEVRSPVVEEQAPPPEVEPPKVSERALYTGTPDSDNYAKGLGGGGINFSLTGRNPVSLPKPEYNAKVSGTVVVRIRVNRDGKVISAEPGQRGTTITDGNLWESAKKAALKARFNAKSDAAYTQAGTITYHFVLQ